MIKGIDVSKYQGHIDWELVKASDYKYAMLRVGWCGYDGLITKGLDSHFERNIKECNRLGIPCGVYVYSYAKTPEAALICAHEVLRLVEPYKVELPIAFDFEDSGVYGNNPKELNTAICKAFLSEIERNKYYSILYASTSMLNNWLNINDLSAYDNWVADYRGFCGYKGAYGIWQYTSGESVPGITGRCDADEFYKEYPKIIKEAGLNHLSEDQIDALRLALERIKAICEESL